MKLIKISSLEKGYHEIDTLMLHGNFQLLVDYIEQQDAFNFIDWDSDKNSRKIKKELEYLYNWWKKDRPEKLKHIDDYIDKSNCGKPNKLGVIDFNLIKKQFPKYVKALNEMDKLDKELYKEETENLIKLIKLRAYLWT